MRDADTSTPLPPTTANAPRTPTWAALSIARAISLRACRSGMSIGWLMPSADRSLGPGAGATPALDLGHELVGEHPHRPRHGVRPHSRMVELDHHLVEVSLLVELEHRHHVVGRPDRERLTEDADAGRVAHFLHRRQRHLEPAPSVEGHPPVQRALGLVP